MKGKGQRDLAENSLIIIESKKRQKNKDKIIGGDPGMKKKTYILTKNYILLINIEYCKFLLL